MVTKTIVNIGLILLIVLGFFSKFHVDEQFDQHLSLSESVNEVTLVNKSADKVNLDFNLSFIHTCHIGHSGCFFNLPVQSVLLTTIFSGVHFGHSPEFNYLNPFQKLLKRPPLT